MEGFEPPIQFPVYAISSRAHSTSSATSPKTLVYYTQTDFLFKGKLSYEYTSFDFCSVHDTIGGMKTFNEQVYDIVARIPAGRVATYGQIARMIGRPKMARFVGFSSNNKNSWHLPWHRVVFKDGRLIPGWAEQQRRDLSAEGVKFRSDGTIDMDKYQWNPERDGVPMDIRDMPLVF